MNELLVEWWTGTASDLAHRWSESEVVGIPSRVYEAHLDDLTAMLASFYGEEFIVRACLVEGAEGQTDLRIELESSGKVEIIRWRPPYGTKDLDDVFESGQSAPRRRNAIARQRVLARAHQALTISDPGTLGWQELLDSVASLKHLRMKLRERAEGGDTNVDGRLADVEAKLGLFQGQLDIMRRAKAQRRGV